MMCRANDPGRILRGAKPTHLPVEQPHQVRSCYQSTHGQSARHHNPGTIPTAGRRGNRMKLANFRLWHYAEVPACPLLCRESGDKQTCLEPPWIVALQIEA